MEQEEEIFMDEEEKSMDPLGAVTGFLRDYGWYMVGLVIVYGAFRNKINEFINSWLAEWKERRYDALYKKNPDLARARLEGLAAARERMQEEFKRKSAEALAKKKELEEQKRLEKLSQLDNSGGQTLGPSTSTKKNAFKEEYNPLMGDGGQRYVPPKKSCCKKGGGCG